MAVTNFVWDVENDSYLMETDGSGQTQATYTSEPVEYGSLVSQERAGTTHYYHSDVVGSTRQLTDANEATTDSYDYTAFGESVAQSGSTTNPFRFWGQFGGYSDAELANEVYVRRRHYLRSEGRWGSVDPIGFVGGANLYSVSRNVPVMLVDPSGLLCAPRQCEKTTYREFPDEFCRKRDEARACCFPQKVSGKKPVSTKICRKRAAACMVGCYPCTATGGVGEQRRKCCGQCTTNCEIEARDNCCAKLFWGQIFCKFAVDQIATLFTAYCESGLPKDLPEDWEDDLPQTLPDPPIPTRPPSPPSAADIDDLRLRSR